MQRKSAELLQKELAHAKKLVVIGGIYSHYKNPNNHYKVHDLAIQEATNAICVVYEALYLEGIFFVRDLDNWLETLSINGKKQKRFTLVTHL